MTITIDEIQSFCLLKKRTTSEEFPFDQDTLVFKVLGKYLQFVPLSDWEQEIPRLP